MSGHKRLFLAFAGTIALITGAAADQAKPTPPAPTAARPNDEGAAPRKLIAPVRGLANIDYTLPDSRRKGAMVITTIRVKNRMSAPIAGLKVDEFWYGKSGDPVGGGTARLRKPLMPGEIAEVVIEFRSAPDMNRNSYKFTHVNGDIKPTQVRRLDPPKP